MSLESVFKLSLVMNMVDHLTGPMARVSSNVGGSVSKLENMNQTLGNMTKTGATMAGVGAQITDATLAPVKATFETKRALGELKSVGVQDLKTLEKASKDFSDTWAGTSKAEFIGAAYDIKSGIASLSDEAVAKYTEIAGITAKGTKASIGEMTSLFATGYGIYKDFYKNMGDIPFGEMFAAGIAHTANIYKTDGPQMAQAISRLGAAATTAKVPMEEQFAILGQLQATMSGSEAGTKYKAFLQSAAQAGQELGLKFTDTNNQLLSMPEILDKLRGKFGETMDAAEKMQLQKAFGTDEAVSLVDLLYSKTGTLQDGILSIYDAMGSGMSEVKEMANAINETEPDKYQVLQQRLHNVLETIGNGLLPTVNQFLGKGAEVLTNVSGWIDKNQDLVRAIMLVVLAIGGFLAVGGTTIAAVGSVGLIFTKTAGMIKGFVGIVKGIPSALDTIHIMALYAGDGLSKFGGFLKTGAGAIGDFAGGIAKVTGSGLRTFSGLLKTGAGAAKDFSVGLVKMAAQGIASAVRALPGLIASTWSFTAALLANPITWIVIGIMALVAAIILLWRNWDSVTAFLNTAWSAACSGVSAGLQWLSNGFQAFLAFFRSIGTGIKGGLDSIRQFFQGIIDWIGGKIAWFGEAGKRLINTFVGGIKSVAMAPINAVKGIFGKIGNLFPHSDAKEGPLSTLTLSGRKTMTTYAQGVKLAEGAPAEAIEKGLGRSKAALTREPVKKIKLGSSKKQEDEDEGENSNSGKAKSVIIKKLLMQVDLKQIKDLQLLLKLLGEIEDYTNGNGDEEDDDSDGDLTATPEPA